MQIFRFMSVKEFALYLSGRKLINNTKHKRPTNSVGFCFLSLGQYKPEQAFHFLTGIVSCDVCVVFEVDRSKIIKSWGKYSKRNKSNRNISR